MRAITIAPWRPARMSLLPMMGQTPLPMAPVAPPRLAFIDSPLAQLITDVTASVASGMLGYAFGKEGSRWSTVFWAVASVAGFKAFFDGYRLNR